MNVVVWSSAGQFYATPTDQVVEVISVVQTRPLPQVPPWVRGLMNYRGRLIELLDMPLRLGQAPCESRMASRILVVQTDRREQGESKLVGLLVEELFGSQDLDFTDRSGHPGLSPDEIEFLGPVALTEAGTVQLTDPSRIVIPGWNSAIVPPSPDR
jgi:chemotaxis signal transduction protein